MMSFEYYCNTHTTQQGGVFIHTRVHLDIDTGQLHREFMYHRTAIQRGTTLSDFTSPLYKGWPFLHEIAMPISIA